jgi:hypothetical protein
MEPLKRVIDKHVSKKMFGEVKVASDAKNSPEPIFMSVLFHMMRMVVDSDEIILESAVDVKVDVDMRKMDREQILKTQTHRNDFDLCSPVSIQRMAAFTKIIDSSPKLPMFRKCLSERQRIVGAPSINLPKAMGLGKKIGHFSLYFEITMKETYCTEK